VNFTGDATEVPTVLTWKRELVAVFPVVSWMRNGFVVEVPKVRVVVYVLMLRERFAVGFVSADQVDDAPPPVAVIVMIFGELVEIEMPEPATIEVVEFERPLIAVIPLPPVPDAFSGSHVDPFQVRTWFVFGAVDETARPWIPTTVGADAELPRSPAI